MRKTMQELREELGVVSQGKVGCTENSVLFHLAFRLTETEAKKYILTCAEIGTSESLYARKAILEKLEVKKDAV